MNALGHTHPDADRLTIGCSGCVARAEKARIENAPVRQCVWHCTYQHLDEVGSLADPVERTLKLTLAVKVPDGWTPDQVDELHASTVGDAFVQNLPDDVPMDHTQFAMETMHVEKVVIGDLVDTRPPVVVEQGSLL